MWCASWNNGGSLGATLIVAALSWASLSISQAEERAVAPDSTTTAVEQAQSRLPARQPDRFREAGPSAAKPTERQREGTKLVEQIGTFEFLGDRAAFLPAGAKESYRVLENLALERVSRQTIDNRGQQEWTINGVLTEFKGGNYLLITKAVARSAE